MHSGEIRERGGKNISKFTKKSKKNNPWRNAYPITLFFVMLIFDKRYSVRDISSPISLGCRSMLLRQPKLEEKMLSICRSSMLSAVSSMLTAAACCAERTKTWRKMTIINFIFPSETASISLATMFSISLVPVVWTLWRSTSKTT